MQVGDYDQYIVRIDGSRRLTLRIRRFMCKLIAPDLAAYGVLPPKQSILGRVPTTRCVSRCLFSTDIQCTTADTRGSSANCISAEAASNQEKPD